MKKRILSIVLTLCLVLAFMPQTAFAGTSGVCGTNLTWTLDDNGTLTISGTGDMSNWSSNRDLPWYGNCSSIRTIVINSDVTSIGNQAFAGCTSLTSVTIPNSVTSIGKGAFFGCTNLTSVTIPDSVTSIKASAFQGCISLTSITIPSSVTSIGDYAFQNCTGLTSVDITYGVTSIGQEAFRDCTGLTSIAIPNSVTDIKNYAFQGCTGLTSITIPSSVTSITVGTFLGCERLASVTIPSSVTLIGNNAFERCTSLESINIPNGVTSIGANAFSGCTSLESIFLPDGLDVSSAKIPAATTQVRYSLDTEGKVTITGIKLGTGKTSVDIPSTISGNPVTAIGNFAFDSCYGLESVTFGENSQLKSIGNYAFLNCTSLTSINIPGSVTYIGMGAFRCGGLTSITVDPNNSNYSSADGVLFNKDKTELIHYPTGNTRTSYSIPSSVTSIGNKAFMSCKKLENVTFGVNSKLESIEEDAFYDCTSLKSIIIPNNVMVINERAFSGCNNLESIFLSDKVSNIGIAAIPDTTSQVKYSLDTNKGEITITEITLGTNKTSVDIPAEICGHSVVAVADGLLGNISSHTCVGGQATCQTKATCGICGNEYGEIDSTNHNLEKISAKDATVTETGNKEYWHCKDCGKYFSDENGKSEIIDLASWKAGEGKLAKLPPEIINGKGMSMTAGETKELTFRSNADFSDFIRVELDGKTLDAKYYTAKEGSTIITLKADYVASLSAGNHTIGIVSTSGTATTEFTVTVQTASDNGSPKTGDNSNLILWLALMILSASGTAGAAVCSKKKRTNE